MEDYRARNIPAPHWFECVWSSEKLGVKCQPVYAKAAYRINVCRDFSALPGLPLDAVILPMRDANPDKAQSIDALLNAGMGSVPSPAGVVYVFPQKAAASKKAL